MDTDDMMEEQDFREEEKREEGPCDDCGEVGPLFWSPDEIYQQCASCNESHGNPSDYAERMMERAAMGLDKF